jgi:hypothetical protein
VLLEVIAAFTSVGIAVSLYPVLRKWHVGLALGAVVFRTIEAVMYLAGAVGLLALVTLGRQVDGAGVAGRAPLQAIGDSLVTLREDAILMGVFAFTVGAFMYYVAFFQSGLIPRWLSGWGIAGVVAMFAACVWALFSHNPVTSYTVLVLPIAVQEMVLAVWLIVRGFSPLEAQPGSASHTKAIVLAQGVEP